GYVWWGVVGLIVWFRYSRGGLGGFCGRFIIQKLPEWRGIIMGVAAIAVIALVVPPIWRTINSPQSKLFGTEWFEDTLHSFRFTKQEWLPSTWLTNGLLEAARPPAVVLTDRIADLPIVQSVLYLALLVSNALFFHVLTVWAAKHWFRASYANLACRPTRRRQVGGAISDRIFSFLLTPFPQPLQLLLIKDWRLLRRDPVQ